MAANLRDQVNAITNSGTSYPPPNSYTGQRLVTASSPSQYSGDLQIAVLGSSGNPIASPYADEPNGMPPLTLDLSTLNYGQGAGRAYSQPTSSAPSTSITGCRKTSLRSAISIMWQLALSSGTITGALGSTVSFGFNLNNIVSSTVTNSNASFTVTGTPQIFVNNTTTVCGK